MPTMNMIQALNDAHKVAMRGDPDIVVFGEDAGYFGGVFRVTEGLQKEFGKTRVFDAHQRGGHHRNGGGHGGIWPQAGRRNPIRRLHLSRLRPDRQRGREIRYRTAADWTMPMVIRTPYGGGIFGGQTHGQ